MGSCTTREHSSSLNPGFCLQNLDLALLKSHNDYSQYQAYQKFLSVHWKSFKSPPSQQDSLSIPDFHEMIRKGVPDSLVLKVIRSLFVMDSQKAEIVYKDIQKNFPETSQFSTESLSYLDSLYEASFCLTEAAQYSTKRIVFFLNFILNTSSLKYLPKIVQSLLWYLEEAEVFYLIVGMVKQDVEKIGCLANPDVFSSQQKYFLNSEEIWRVSERIARVLTRQEGSYELVTRVVVDLIENFAVGLLPMIYYPFLMCNFLLDRADSLIKLAFSVFSCIQLADLHTQEQVRQQLVEKFNYSRFIETFLRTSPGEMQETLKK